MLAVRRIAHDAVMEQRVAEVVQQRSRLVGELVDAESLAARAAAVAAEQGAPLTRQTYASVYRAFCAFVGPDAGADAFTSEQVRAYRDELEGAGRSPATIAKHLSALRTLAATLGTDGVRNVRGAKVARGEPRALSAEQYARLLRMPDLRTTAGKRDLALLHLLGTAGLRRAEASALLVADVDEHPRADDARLRRAFGHSTPWWLTVRRGKRGRRRRVPLEQAALDALTSWVRVRPTCAHDELLVSLPRTGRPSRPLTVRDVTRIVTRYAAAAGLPADRRSPHVLRHTFCTHLANAGAAIDVIRELAGHADIRTTTIYTAVHDDRLEDAIENAARRRRGLAKRT
jgi:integrase/recombinase XerD